MEQRDESTVNNSGNKPQSSENPSETTSCATNNEIEIVNHQGLQDFETISVNHSGNPIIPPEIQSSFPLNHQNLDPSSPLPPLLPLKIPDEDDVSNPKSMSVPRWPSNCSDDDLPISSVPDLGLAMQNPPMQVMERAAPGSPSAYRIPSHVFDRTNTRAAEWSIASNESLFSIYMGNMSFSRDLEWLNSEMSGPLPPLTSDNNNGGNMNNQSQDNKPKYPSTDNQSQVNKSNDISIGDESQANKFNNMSQIVGKNHQDYGEMTDAKAAEIMRQVIMENSQDYVNHGNNVNELSRHSNCSSTWSFAFNLRPKGGKSQHSPKGFQVHEKPKLKKTQTGTGTPKELPKASTQATEPCSNAPFKWLCCFTCCINTCGLTG